MKLSLFGRFRNSQGEGLLRPLRGSLWLVAFAAGAWADEVSVDCWLKISQGGTNATVVWEWPPECGTNIIGLDGSVLATLLPAVPGNLF